MATFIKPCEGRVTSPFGWRQHPIRKERSWHQGVDLAQAGNISIHAAAAGVVTRNQVLGTYGNVVMIVHKINGKTYETNYAHLKPGSKMIVGQRVKQGDVIGYMGNTGSSTAQHLHFEIHNGRWEAGQPNAVNPLHYLCFPEVKELQEKLNEIGYKLVEDGINGNKTTAAVKDFQRKQKLVVDGNAGPATLKVLATVINILKNPKPKLTPVSNVKEEKDMLAKAIVIGSSKDYAAAEVLAIRLKAPIYPCGAIEGENAKELLVVGGDITGLKADKITNLSGATFFDTTANVERYLK